MQITIQILHLGYSVQHTTGKCSLTLWITEKTGEVNVAELGQIRTAAEWYHPLPVSSAGTFPHVSAIGTCTPGIRIPRCYTFVALPFEVQENLLHLWILFHGITCIWLKQLLSNSALESLLPKLAGRVCHRAQLKASRTGHFQPISSCSKQLQAVAALQQQLILWESIPTSLPDAEIWWQWCFASFKTVMKKEASIFLMPPFQGFPCKSHLRGFPYTEQSTSWMLELLWFLGGRIKSYVSCSQEIILR